MLVIPQREIVIWFIRKEREKEDFGIHLKLDKIWQPTLQNPI